MARRITSESPLHSTNLSMDLQLTCAIAPGKVSATGGSTLQNGLLKFVGCLNKAFAEDHSGWSYDDYFDMAKKYYLAITNREFNRNCLWLEVKRLPKFAADVNQMSPSSKRGLSLDSADGQQPDVDGDAVDGVADQNSPDIPKLALAQRPSIGKKKAKKIKFEKAQTNEASVSMLGQWMQQMAKAQEERLSVCRARENTNRA
ncbi:unnamed protein product (mitochondrion) [Plasmodiophora brassicae]|uniref:No apical meristem-associated C-terminal domain-containing protein n=1 Tax=Plasmodiophora brassicae TaxID=37360 RepID=A0A0G4J921_PLABS|nr:hypothetical protein PBRA_009534 [Plasmodiophora brassicae]SPQ96950.1 unnamed protein product [Plasmodiophora brassicae]